MDMETLRATYQQMHDDRGRGTIAVMVDDGGGRVAFYNLRVGVWEWYGFDVRAGGYILTGSTATA